MRREVLISFVLWFVFAVLGPILIGHFYFGLPLDAEIIQNAVLGTLAGSLFFYLFYRLYRIRVAAAVIFVIVGSMAIPLAYHVYSRYFPYIDTRQQLLHVLAALAVTTAIVHFVRRNSPS
ncbi:MAG: hypothetical protein QOJ64_4002 [Acidobacteriota bacterium]|nr:hypothetical protein [Acidobacteriota bacterium]